ncbi:MAG: hypothetical protein ACTHU0_30140 [Kofleriaceae bacterium]
MRRFAIALGLGLFGCSDPSHGVPDAAAVDPDAAIDPDAPVSPDAPDAPVPECHDGETRACGSDVGACEPGTETCAEGHWGSCEGGIGPANERCEGSIDEDCDGEVDEGCTNDPFDPASCGGTPWTGAEALAALAGAPRDVLASATIEIRSRTCSGDESTCGPWGPGSAWQTRFLTYSGGSTTRYINLQADTSLVLFESAGAAKLSIQHVTFAAGGYPDADGIVFGFPPAPIQYPRFRAYNVAPQYPSDYRDLALDLKNGALVLGDGCARFTANVFGAPAPYTTELAALYRW